MRRQTQILHNSVRSRRHLQPPLRNKANLKRQKKRTPRIHDLTPAIRQPSGRPMRRQTQVLHNSVRSRRHLQPPLRNRANLKRRKRTPRMHDLTPAIRQPSGRPMRRQTQVLHNSVRSRRHLQTPLRNKANLKRQKKRTPRMHDLTPAIRQPSGRPMRRQTQILHNSVRSRRHLQPPLRNGTNLKRRKRTPRIHDLTPAIRQPSGRPMRRQTQVLHNSVRSRRHLQPPLRNKANLKRRKRTPRIHDLTPAIRQPSGRPMRRQTQVLHNSVRSRRHLQPPLRNGTNLKRRKRTPHTHNPTPPTRQPSGRPMRRQTQTYVP